MSHASAMPLTARRGGALHGTAEIPGDKSVSHRALILGALTVGETRVTGLLEGEDVLATARAMRAFGANLVRGDDGAWTIHGVGVGGFAEPADVIDCGNAGTGVRLIMGSDGDDGDLRHLHRRRLAAPPADGPRARPAAAVRRREPRAGPAGCCR